MGERNTSGFIPGASCSVAYADRPVSIGKEQTISQPLIVALMTHFAEVKFDNTVTGSWHRFRLPGRNTGAAGAKGLYRRDYPPLAEAAAEIAEKPRLQQRERQGRQQLPRLAGMRSFQRNHRDSCTRHLPATADRTTNSGWPARNATGARPRHTAAHRRKKIAAGRRRHTPLCSSALCRLPGLRIECPIARDKDACLLV